MTDRNLVLQLLITAKDEATSAFGKVFKYLDDNTKVVAGKIRAAFSGIFGGGLESAKDFEAQLDRVAAKGGYTAQEMDALAGQVRTLGAQFGVSGTEAAQGMEALAAAGLSAHDALGALPSVLALAASEQISCDAASEQLIDSLSIMGLEFSEAGRMADVLAKGANLTTSSASQLAEALTQAGGMAKAAGLDLESTVAALDLLHKNGIKGSEAGTALKGILTALLDPSSKASQELTALGITSRDLGTVLGGLKDKGSEANTAILAFGTEAGPGLRALISEGQAGLNTYTLQLKSADGAASDAAEQMGGNLKSALKTLSSAWDSLKAALLEPLLAPIAAQVRDLGVAFQDGLASEKFKAIQDGIRAFGETAAQAIGDFVRSFNFTAALQSLEQFSATAQSAFTGVSGIGKDAANVVMIGWNAVTGGFRTIGAALLEVAASAVATLANMEAAASTIGLGSAQRAEELRQSAINLQNQAVTLLNQATDDGRELQGAFEQLGQRVDGVKTKTKALADTPIVPNAQTLEPIQKSLSDYAGLLDRAKTSQAAAADAADAAQHAYLEIGQLYDQGQVSLTEYEQAKRKDAEAQAALTVATGLSAAAQRDLDVATQEAIRGITQESTTLTAGIKTKKDLAVESLTAAHSSGTYADALQKSGDAAAEVIRAERELAQAKGDGAEVQRLSVLLAQQEAQTAQAVAAVKAQEAAQTQAAYVQQQAYLASIGGGTEVQKQELELLRLKAVALGDEAKAAQMGAEIKALAAKQTGPQITQQQQLTTATQGLTHALGEQASQQQRTNEQSRSAADIGQGLVAAQKAQQAQMDSLSQATRNLFEVELAHGLFRAGIPGSMAAMHQAQRTYSAGVDESSQKLAEFARKEEEAIALIKASEEKLRFAANGFRAYEAAVELASGKAKQAYYEQAQSAEQLRLKVVELGEHGSSAFVTLESATQKLETGFHLLDDQDLAGLRGAIETATEKLKAMQEATQSAQDRLAELNAELAEAQGADEKARLLREQLDYQQRLADLEKQRQDAELTGNTELVTTLDKQREVLEKIHTTKLANIEAEAAADTAADKTVGKYRDLAEAVERTGTGMKALAGVDLGGLVTSSGRALDHFRSLQELL